MHDSTAPTDCLPLGRNSGLSANQRLHNGAAEAFLCAATAPAWVVDAQLHLVTCNDAFLALMRAEYQLEVCPGDSIDVLPEPVRSEHAAMYRAVLKGKSLRLEWSPSAERTYDVHLEPITDGGERVGIAVFCVDQSARVAAQRDLAVAKEQAESSNRAKSDFLAQISHEIRTPLNAIVGLTDMALSADELPHPVLERVHSNAAALLHLLNDLLDFSQIEAGLMSVQPMVVDPGKLFRDVADFHQPRAQQKGLEVSVTVDPDVPRGVWLDPARFRQVLTNLLSNAIKYTARGGVQLRLSWIEDGPRWFLEVAVQDTGFGIPKSEQQLIFTRFYRAYRSTTGRTSGTGLGLAITKSVVELMGGKIRLKSAPGQGSLFRVRVPVELASPVSIHPEGLRRPLTLLLADDHADNHAVVRAMVRSRLDEVLAVADGREALFAVATRAFDAILMDVDMPVMDGVRATAEIRDQESQRGSVRVPIIAITAHATSEVRKRCEDAGVDAFLTKPLQPEALLQAIDQLVDARVRVLLVDDAPDNLFIMEKMTERAGGLALTASTGEEAASVVQQFPVDLIVLDFELPDTTGPELAIRLRDQGFEGGFIGCSGHVDAVHDAAWRGVGIHHVVHKPVRLARLQEVLRLACLDQWGDTTDVE